MSARFARRPRSVALGALVLVAVVSCVNLGLWQLRRLEGRRAVNARITSREQLPALSAGEIARAPDPAGLEHRRAIVRGTYDTEREIVLVSRSHRGAAGNHVLTPLALPDGDAILVDRGWFPITLGQDPPVARASPPSGVVEVGGALFPSQRPGRFGPREAGAGPLEATYRVDLERLRAQFPYPILPVWMVLRAQHPANAGELPIPQDPPSIGDGPHLAYAIQWFLFAMVAVAGYMLVLREAARRARAEPQRTERERSFPDIPS